MKAQKIWRVIFLLSALGMSGSYVNAATEISNDGIYVEAGTPRPPQTASPSLPPPEPIGAPYFAVGASSLNISLGNSVNVEFTIHNLNEFAAPSLGDYEFNISFDNAVLSFSSITWGNGLDLQGLGSLRDIDTSQAAHGLLNLFEVSLDDVDALQPATFTLFTLTFNAIGLGTSPIAMQATFGDGLGNPMALLSDSNVNINAVPVPAALPLFVSGLLAAAGVKRRRR